MQIWSNEIEDLGNLYRSLKGTLPALEVELQRLVLSKDENMLLVYSRRCLEVIISHLCERELKRQRGTEPLQRIIDKLNKDETVPHNIIVSMQNVNSMSTFGAHPKKFEIRQIKPVLVNLSTIIEWYISYLKSTSGQITVQDKYIAKPVSELKIKFHSKKSKRRRWMIAAQLLIAAIIIVSLVLLDIIRIDTPLKTAGIDSIVILPFDNITGSEKFDHVVSGMQSMLINDMQQLGNLRIPCKTSSNAFKNANLTIKNITAELEVDAAMESEVSCFGDTICIWLKLVSANREEKQIWSKDYKVAKGEINKLSKEVTRDIAEQVNVKLSLREKQLLAEWKNVDPEAVDFYVEGLYYLDQISHESLLKAIEYFEKAIGVDPEWAAPYAGLAEVGSYQNQMGFVPADQALSLIKPNLETALELDPNSANSHYVKAVIAVWTEWDWEKGEDGFTRSLELNPNNALCRVFYSHLLMILGRMDEAQKQAKEALKLDPMRPFILGLNSVVLIEAGRYQAALNHCKKALSIKPDHYFSKGQLSEAYLNLKDYDSYFEEWKEWVLTYYTELWNEKNTAEAEMIYREKGYLSLVEEIIRLNEDYRERTGKFYPLGMANLCLEVENYEKAIDYMEIGYELHKPGMPYLTRLAKRYPKLRKNRRYIALLNKMDLPLL